jgi:CRISPR-associated protein Cas6
LLLEAEEQDSQLNQCPSINVSFALSGKQLPADHGYLVYSAISQSSSLHRIDWLAIELISGFPSGRGLINLPERDATLRLRIPAEHYRDVLLLAGKRLDISGHQIRLGLPVARPLEPASSLYARVVTIKKFTEAEPFIDAVKRKLDSFGIKGRVELPLNERGRYRRRIVTIHGKSVVGFSVAVHELNDDDSILLQAGAVKILSPDKSATQWQSIFSRRAMGCGIFNPIMGSVTTEEE